jgi:hypothetical protein
MAKDSPWFKFISSEWRDGIISICSYPAKGLFTDLLALYWSREGDLSKAFAMQKTTEDPALWGELFEREVLGLAEEKLVIKFLDEQLLTRQETSQKARDSINARWEKVRNNRQGDYKKGANGAKNTVVSESNYDQNTVDKSSYYEPDTNKKEKEKEIKIPHSVGSEGSLNGHANKPGSLPPLRAADPSGRNKSVWKKYGEKLETVFAKDPPPTREKLIRAFTFFWPSEFKPDPVENAFKSLTDAQVETVLGELWQVLETYEIESIKGGAVKFINRQDDDN